ncbi:MAG: ABC transporter permease [bacterium]|nr:ABC transporter permease [bacterium]MCY4162715.1 ABC transporter permease [bacterium]MCY4257605.1 ABC transporter permease [bacterium]
MSEAAVIGLFVATVQFATLVYLAALGELIAERAGVLNLGVEGMMAMGAVSGFMVGLETGSPWAAFVVAAAVGALVGGFHALISVVLGADQVVSGLALTIGGVGLAAYVGRNVGGRIPETKFTDMSIIGLSEIRWFGDIFFNQPPVVYLAVLLGAGSWFVLARTRLGLALRAVGESAPTTDAVGHSVVGLRVAAVMVGGGLAGAAGSFLSLYMAPGWTEGMVAGRGWIAVALVIFGAWKPGRLAAGALLFGFTLALQPRLQSFDINFLGLQVNQISPALLGMLPFLLTVAVLVVISWRYRHGPSPAPASLGIAYRREER